MQKQNREGMDMITRLETLITSLIPAASGKHGSTFNHQQRRFAPCPDSPNCVSTQATPEDKIHAISPMQYDGSLKEAHQQILAIIKSTPRTTLVTVQAEYIHAEFRSRIFSFVDDVEFYFDAQQSQIHFRSASRLGHGDLGVNRKRMEEIRRRFKVQSKRPR
jgi:uncharacterized protein (DUF1499 family)